MYSAISCSHNEWSMPFTVRPFSIDALSLNFDRGSSSAFCRCRPTVLIDHQRGNVNNSKAISLIITVGLYSITLGHPIPKVMPRWLIQPP